MTALVKQLVLYTHTHTNTTKALLVHFVLRASAHHFRAVSDPDKLTVCCIHFAIGCKIIDRKHNFIQMYTKDMVMLQVFVLELLADFFFHIFFRI